MQILNPVFGADIELFLQDKRTKEIISAEGYIPGDKYEPYVFDPTNKYFAVSLDNVSAEFCIPPARSVDEWFANINKSVDFINKTIPNDFCTAAIPSACLDERFLQTANAKRFGCEPDANVWLRKLNPSPKAKNTNLRSCGGHIHIGYDNASNEGDGFYVKECIIKAMDLFVGVPSVIQEPDNERKLLYGKAGAFREKPYGVEYRTVSNYYLASEPLTKWAYNNSKAAVDFLVERGIEEIEAVGEQIQQAINGCDKTLAGNLIRQFNIQMV